MRAPKARQASSGRLIEFLDVLPRTPTGKLQRGVLCNTT